MTIDQPTERKLGKLRTWNIIVGLILAVQAVVMGVLTNNFSLPVTATFMQGPPGSAASLQYIFNIQTGWGHLYVHGDIGFGTPFNCLSMDFPVVQT